MTETPATTVYFASRPRLRVNGEQLPDLGEGLLRTLFVEETTLGLFRCEASFRNTGNSSAQEGYLLFDRRTLDFGKTFSVEFGHPGDEGPVFSGRISGLEASYLPDGQAELLILAEDGFQELRAERRTRTFEKTTDAKVIKQVASQNNLTHRVDVDGPTHRLVAQVNQTDLAFLRERAAAVGADLWFDDRTLYAQTRARRNHGNLTLAYGGRLLEFTVLADLAHQRTSLRITGWDVGEKATIDVEATASTVQAELHGGHSGSALLPATRTERLAGVVPLSRQEAQSLAETRYRARARGFVRGQGVADGSPALRVGTTVTLEEIGPLFDGPYYVTMARHSFDTFNGYRTTFHVERPWIGPGSGG
jgi:uncharacterized protein